MTKQDFELAANELLKESDHFQVHICANRNLGLNGTEPISILIGRESVCTNRENYDASGEYDFLGENLLRVFIKRVNYGNTSRALVNSRFKNTIIIDTNTIQYLSLK